MKQDGPPSHLHTRPWRVRSCQQLLQAARIESKRHFLGIQHGVYWASPITAIVKPRLSCVYSPFFFFFLALQESCPGVSVTGTQCSHCQGPGLNLWAGASDPAGHAAWWTKNKPILVRTCQSWTWFYVYLVVLPFRGGRDDVYYPLTEEFMLWNIFTWAECVGLSLHSCRRQSGEIFE